MSSRALFKDKQLRLCVVTTLAAGPVVSTTEALLLPPKPLAFSSTWDCRSGSGNDWLCRTNSGHGYSESLESVTQGHSPELRHSYEYHPVANGQLGYEQSQPHLASNLQHTVNPIIANSAVLLELLNAPPDNYVLQWLAANDREPLEQLKAQNPILHDATIAHYQRAGRQWYILLDGPFPNRITAMTALKQEPRAHIATKFYPWTRSIASIQQLNFIRPYQIADHENRYPSTNTHTPPNKLKRPVYRQPPATTKPLNNEKLLPEGYYEARGRYRKNAVELGLYPDEQQLIRPSERSNNYHHIYPEPNQDPENFNGYFADTHNLIPTSVPDRYGYPRDYIETYSGLRQAPSQLAQPFHNNETYPNTYNQHKRYRASQEAQYNQKQTPQQKAYNPYAMSERYLNNLRYATASASPQVAMPDSRYQHNTEMNHTYQVDYSVEKNKQPYYNTLQPTYYDHEHQPTLDQQPRPTPFNRDDYGASAIRPEALHSGYSHPYTDTALNAPPGSYTIQWLAANNKTSLERIQLRYPALQNARIIHYRRQNTDWYVLVSGAYVSREAAQSALSLPPYSKLTARLYPWVRSVKALQKMVAGTIKKKPDSYSQQTSPLKNITSGADNSYTIQWYAANKAEAVRRMKKRFPELADAVTVHFRRNKKDWYVLLQGQYNTSQDAISAIKSPLMRDAARMLHPWTRPLNTLKNIDFQEKS
ncbi:MAG: SPOR domain-containing protein [Endozoicomonas sp. (ex Botrylloides leachii)]|nr:SPOR domain-containing protein [Endozoicomonas sp. (ex Botrylloides leachii)]